MSSSGSSSTSRTRALALGLAALATQAAPLPAARGAAPEVESAPTAATAQGSTAPARAILIPMLEEDSLEPVTDVPYPAEALLPVESAATAAIAPGTSTPFAAALAVATGATAPARPVRPTPITDRRLALLPVQNLTAGPAPTKALTAALRERLEQRGIPLVPDAEVRKVLAEHRVRWAGGLDRATAKALRLEAGIDGVIVTSVEAYGPVLPYRFALTSRLVSTEEDPVVLWSDLFSRTGDDHPGLLGLGLVPSVEGLADRALEQVTGSLASVLVRPRPLPPCPEWGARAPRRFFRSPLVLEPTRATIAILPFLNGSGRRDAGEVVASRFLTVLAASDRIQVIEPGVVREEMLGHRLGATGTISIDDARVILELVDADLVLSGTVRTFEEMSGGGGAPRVELGVWVLDRNTQQLVWSSSSAAGGEDGVFFFQLGRTSTASGLACGLARGAVDALLAGRPQGVARRPYTGLRSRHGGPARTATR